ncbi:DUF624 domain-containing protein [Gracilibacillus sp. YIM 98692]|uniref:YesL family protein n=1 Tax=Gracilibacillus sp. YIM 98692 TaxID=2663532 RepID=UPI0013D35D3F|nr:DUF624 domain-containing protein [Gracilibacillus sp. YIM 98692]
MNSDTFLGKFYQFGEGVLFLFYVNLLWVIGTTMGLLFFGVGPSTVAMFTIFRKWSMGEKGFSVGKIFLAVYRKEFWRANTLSWLMFLFGMMLIVNLQFFAVGNDTWNFLFKAVFMIIFLLYMIMLIYLFPLYVHYQTTFKQYFKNAFLIAIYQPVRTIYLLAACFTLYYLWVTFPIFIVFFGASLTSFIVMWISYRTFARIEYKQSLLQEKEDLLQQPIVNREGMTT